jgi:hypothetical protein
MTDFSKQLMGFSVKTTRVWGELFDRVTEHVQMSVTEGSQVTTAPGQPVDQGILKASWTPDRISATEWQTTTHLDYAPSIEDLVSYAHGGTPITIRSSVGGGHSVKLTRVHFPRLVEYELEQVKAKNV